MLALFGVRAEAPIENIFGLAVRVLGETPIDLCFM